MPCVWYYTIHGHFITCHHIKTEFIDCDFCFHSLITWQFNGSPIFTLEEKEDYWRLKKKKRFQ